MTAAIQYDGTAREIQSETDPFIRDAQGRVIDLTHVSIPGVITRGHSVQRDDEAGTYPHDLAAAQAVAEHVGDGATVWFHPAEPVDAFMAYVSANRAELSGVPGYLTTELALPCANCKAEVGEPCRTRYLDGVGFHHNGAQHFVRQQAAYRLYLATFEAIREVVTV